MNQRNSTLLRSGEKEILHYLYNFADKCVPLLTMQGKVSYILLDMKLYVMCSILEKPFYKHLIINIQSISKKLYYRLSIKKKKKLNNYSNSNVYN